MISSDYIYIILSLLFLKKTEKEINHHVFGDASILKHCVLSKFGITREDVF